VTEAEELELLRRIVVGIMTCQGRESVSDSYELDYCWDLAEEYVESRKLRDD
jgi:hypothetical protein